MHGVKRSLVCFVAVASANPPFIQPSETSRETTESMNDGLIKDILYACFLLNTPITQQNHPSAPCHVSYALQRQPQPCGRRRSSVLHRTHTHTASRDARWVQGHPETKDLHGWAPSRGIEAEVLLLSCGVNWGVVPCHTFFPWQRRRERLEKHPPPSNVILECGVDAFLFVKPRG